MGVPLPLGQHVRDLQLSDYPKGVVRPHIMIAADMLRDRHQAGPTSGRPGYLANADEDDQL